MIYGLLEQYTVCNVNRSFRWADDAGDHELALVWVPGTEGSPYQFGRGPNRPAVDVPGFFIETTPVTQALWRRVMGDNPAKHPDPDCPVENVSWQMIAEPGGFLDRLNASDVRAAVAGGDATLRFRLPSETEWEYAARGGPHWRDDFAFGGSNDPDAVAWYGRRWTRGHQLLVDLFGWPIGWRLANSVPRLRRETHTHPAASKAPNQIGLYDMSGNVWEWCQDACNGDERRLRGGCHHNWDLHCTVWWQYGIQPDAHDGCIGFRVVLATRASAAARPA